MEEQPGAGILYPVMNCLDCDAGPQGMRGHDALTRDHHAQERSAYRCTNCDARFSRSYDGNSVFVWKRLPEPANPAPGGF